jgi:hypothetical protein
MNAYKEGLGKIWKSGIRTATGVFYIELHRSSRDSNGDKGELGQA